MYLPLHSQQITVRFVLRFTPFNAQHPFAQQISSAGFIISGPVLPSAIVSIVTVRPSSMFPDIGAGSSY
jgi:hypothetical protein